MQKWIGEQLLLVFFLIFVLAACSTPVVAAGTKYQYVRHHAEHLSVDFPQKRRLIHFEALYDDKTQTHTFPFLHFHKRSQTPYFRSWQLGFEIMELTNTGTEAKAVRRVLDGKYVVRPDNTIYFEPTNTTYSPMLVGSLLNCRILSRAPRDPRYPYALQVSFLPNIGLAIYPDPQHNPPRYSYSLVFHPSELPASGMGTLVHNFDRVGYQVDIRRHLPEVHFPAPPHPLRITSPPLFLDRTLYFGTATGSLVATQLQGRRPQWIQQKGGSLSPILALGTQLLYGIQSAHGGGILEIAPKQTGQPLKQFELPGPLNRAPVFSGDQIVFATRTGLTPDGKRVSGLVGVINTPSMEYEGTMALDSLEPQGEVGVWGAPTVGHGLVYVVATHSRVRGTRIARRFLTDRPMAEENRFDASYVYALNLAEQKMAWQFPRDNRRHIGHSWGTPLLLGNTLIVSSSGDSRGNTIFALNAQSGELLWQQKTEGAATTEPAIHNKLVFFGSLGGILYGFDVKTGKRLWRYPKRGTIGPIVHSPVIHNATLYVVFHEPAGRKDRDIWIIRAIDIESRTEKWAYRTYHPIDSPAIVSNNLLLFSQGNGMIVGLSLRPDHTSYAHDSLHCAFAILKHRYVHFGHQPFPFEPQIDTPG